MDPTIFRIFGYVLLVVGLAIAILPPRWLALLDGLLSIDMALDHGVYLPHATQDEADEWDPDESREVGFSVGVVGLGFLVGAWLEHGGVILLISGLALLWLEKLAARAVGIAVIGTGVGYSIGITFESAGSIPMAILLGLVGVVAGLVYWDRQESTA